MLFFVLSGFLLFTPWVKAGLDSRPRPALGRYLRHRGARILPAYYLALAGSIALLWGAAGTPGVRLPTDGTLPLFLVFGQNYSLGSVMTLNPPMWTLAVEASFYLVLPLLGALALAGRGGRRRGRAALAVVPVLLVGAGYWWNSWLANQDLVDITWTKTLPAMLPYFAAGMLAAVLVTGRGIPRWTAAGLLLAGAVAVLADARWHALGAVTGSHDLKLRVWRDLLAAGGFAAMVAVAARSDAPRRLLGTRPLAALGILSYGVYLWHVPLLLWLRSAGLLPSSPLLAAAVVLPLTLAVAALSWRLVERPVIAWARDGRGGRRGSSPQRQPRERRERPGRTSRGPRPATSEGGA